LEKGRKAIKLEAWFPTIILVGHLEELKNKNHLLSRRAYQIKEELKGEDDLNWKCDTFSSIKVPRDNYYRNDECDEVIDNLIGLVKMHVENYSKSYDADLINYEVISKEFWFNIAEPGNYQEYHNHANNHFSAVYYVDTPDNCGNIIFQSTENLMDNYTIPNEKTFNSAIGAIKSCGYKPEPTKLLIFKSTLLHMVEKNLSNKNRISIAMNFQLRLKK